jgi:triosephosphate isomerase
MDSKDVSEYLNEMKNFGDSNIILCPTNIFVPYFLKKNWQVGLQDICSYESGSYTGQVFINQAKSIGISHIIIGHSERLETKEEINKKILLSLKYGITPIVCIGENLNQRKKKQTKKIIKNQLKDYLKNTFVNKVIIAYEPIWSIGTNQTLSRKEISEMIIYIKNQIKELYKDEAKVIYGGSINTKNIQSISTIEELDGILVGESATHADEFKKIVKSFDKVS